MRCLGPMALWCAAALAADALAAEWGDWVPRAPGWTARLDYRAEQVSRIESSQERWDALLNLAVTGLLVPNYTDHGYQVVQTPRSVHDRLNATLQKALASGAIGQESRVDQISGPVARFVQLGRLKREIMDELKPMHEAWAGGTPLVATVAYGLRLYQRSNTLTMHTDRLESHVISSIVHVNRKTNEPWPIVIEGFDGKSHEVDLQPGEMLLYESAKCVHGRPRPLNGEWYTSLFIHYKPVDWHLTTAAAKEIAEPRLPLQKPPDGKFDQLRLRGTGYYEPGCAHGWCDLAAVWPPPAAPAEEAALPDAPRGEF
ncbi:hypothetical protein M885DRAFT_545600 [Pelagophyceae sp. CCMP2097]|nr:hypothetical protein M885DRAFT_545600 [Pelagophyceae sp. CCMP2097]